MKIKSYTKHVCSEVHLAVFPKDFLPYLLLQPTSAFEPSATYPRANVIQKTKLK